MVCEISESEKSFEEVELEKVEKELEEAKRRVEELTWKKRWLQENKEIALVLRSSLMIQGEKPKKIEVHNSNEVNIRIEIVVEGVRGIDSYDLQSIEELVRPWYSNGIARFESFYDRNADLLWLRVWF